MSEFSQWLVEELVVFGIAERDQIRGCTEQEIQAIEREVGKRLPLEYREFLLAVGKGAGQLFCGEEIFFADLPELQELGHGIAEDENVTLPEDAYIFMVHQGEQVFFFRLDEGGDDPAVYSFMGGREGFGKGYDHFTALIREEVDLQKAIGPDDPENVTYLKA